MAQNTNDALPTSTLVRSLAHQSEELSKDLDAFADRAFELQRLAKALQQREGRTFRDQAVQADQTSSGPPAFKLERAKRLEAFSFQPCAKKPNWRRLRALNLERVVKETDTRSLTDLYHELAYADLDGESVYDMTEANLVKMVRALQLLLQYQQYNIEQGLQVQQLMQEEKHAIAAGLKQVPELSLEDVQNGLHKLEGEFYKVADADMDAMFTQVRVEERTGARDVLATNLDQVKGALPLDGGVRGPGHKRSSSTSGQMSFARSPARRGP